MGLWLHTCGSASVHCTSFVKIRGRRVQIRRCKGSVLKLVQTQPAHWLDVMFNVKERRIKDSVTGAIGKGGALY